MKLDVVIDGQFGSTGKGLLAAWLSSDRYDLHITNAGAQAGHTSYHQLDDTKRKITAFHLSTAGIHQKLNGGRGLQYLSAGCIIDPVSLLKEIAEFNYTPEDLFIHPNAAVIYDHHRFREGDPFSGPATIASTGKGVGAALADKIMRENNIARNNADLAPYLALTGETPTLYEEAILEIPQGFSLGVNSKHFPHVTSRECTLMQGLADTRIHPSHVREVYMCVRTFPIRVGSTQNGYSGDFYPDSKEVTWESLGQTPEITTVTKRVRRIATFSQQQFTDALLANRPTCVFLNFCNYLKPAELDHLVKRMQMTCQQLGMNPDFLFGHGPYNEDIKVNYE